MTNEELTKLYNDANGIPPGKAPPITTERIFAAMRAAILWERKECARHVEVCTALDRAWKEQGECLIAKGLRARPMP